MHIVIWNIWLMPCSFFSCITSSPEGYDSKSKTLPRSTYSPRPSPREEKTSTLRRSKKSSAFGTFPRKKKERDLYRHRCEFISLDAERRYIQPHSLINFITFWLFTLFVIPVLFLASTGLVLYIFISKVKMSACIFSRIQKQNSDLIHFMQPNWRDIAR